jgi:hypothetical protein
MLGEKVHKSLKEKYPAMEATLHEHGFEEHLHALGSSVAGLCVRMYALGTSVACQLYFDETFQSRRIETNGD